ncbi:MAG: HD domain-containing protein [Tissierellaceae bacterium]
MELSIPTYIERIINKLETNGFRAYIVGGSVRDMIIGKQPSDYDIATDALPDHISRLFKEYKTVEVGKKFGTVVVVQREGNTEVTTFRQDGEYIDGRRPERVFFSKDLKDDLSRRDFTINAMAYSRKTGLVDYFNGIEDLKGKIIKTVGKAEDRFEEDYLRIIRAIRFASQLGFAIEEKTYEACKIYSKYLGSISIERVQEEFFKILLSDKPSKGVRLLEDIGALEIILPELLDTVDFDQKSPYHDKDVYGHTLCVLDKTPAILHLRLAALFHDIGKPHTLSIDEDGIGHFYGHDKWSTETAKKVLKRLRASNELIGRVTILVENHMKRHDDLKEKGLKRLLSKIGEEEIFALIEFQKADKLCSRADANIEDLIQREKDIRAIVEKKEPYSMKHLAINGDDLIKLGYKEGKPLGDVLQHLLKLVLDNPDLNNKQSLIDIALREKD